MVHTFVGLNWKVEKNIQSWWSVKRQLVSTCVFFRQQTGSIKCLTVRCVHFGTSGDLIVTLTVPALSPQIEFVANSSQKTQKWVPKKCDNGWWLNIWCLVEMVSWQWQRGTSCYQKQRNITYNENHFFGSEKYEDIKLLYVTDPDKIGQKSEKMDGKENNPWIGKFLSFVFLDLQSLKIKKTEQTW